MKAFLLALALGIAVGYSLGFKDAKKYDEDIVTRTVTRLRGEAGKYNSDVDAQMDRLEKR
jgi:hypothetical protein